MKKLSLLYDEYIKDKIYEKILFVIYAFLATTGISYLYDLVSDDAISGSFFSVAVFAGCLALLHRCLSTYRKSDDKAMLKRRNRYTFLTSYIFSVLLVMGFQLEQNGMTECGVKGKLHILVIAFLVNFFVIPWVNEVYILLDKKNELFKFKEVRVKKKKIFFISWLVIFVSFIPAFLAYYPIIMSYDFHAQVLMSERGYIWFSQHHPQIHTFQISCFYNLGKAIGSPQTGMAFMAIFHMLIVSVCMAYSVEVISKIIPSRKTPFIVTAIFSLYPINAVMTVSTTKDVMYAAMFLLFFAVLFDRFLFTKGRRNEIIMDIFVVLSGILMSLYRMNASYAVVAAALVLVIFVPKKMKIRVLAYGILIFVGFKLSYSGIRTALGTQIGSEPMEKYSLITQAYARVGYYHSQDMDEETRNIISYYLPEESWVEYNPQLSDPCKAAAAVVYWEHWAPDMAKTFGDFLKIFLKYPNEFIDSFLETNRGYWFIDDTSYCTCLGEGLEGRMGILYTYNSSYTEGEVEEILHESKLPWVEDLYENLVSANCFMDWPVISTLFKTSFYCILLVWMFFMALYTKNRKSLGLLVLAEVYFATLLLGPIVQIRYAFPLMIIIPLFVALELSHKSKSEENVSK